MMNRRMLKNWLAALALLFAPGAAFAGYMGFTVGADYRYPDLATSYAAAGGPFQAVVNSGVEFSFFPGFANPTVDVADASIRIDYPLGFGFSSATDPFDGIVVTSISSGIPNIVGASLGSTNIADPMSITFDARHVYINQNVVSSINAGGFAVINVQFAAPVAAAPVPTMSDGTRWLMILIIAGLGVFAATRRRIG